MEMVDFKKPLLWRFQFFSHIDFSPKMKNLEPSFTNNEKNWFSSFFPTFLWIFLNQQCCWKFQFLAGINNFKNFIFCQIFTIFQSGLGWRHCKTWKNHQKWLKFGKNWRKLIFHFWPSIFFEKTKIEKLQKTKMTLFQISKCTKHVSSIKNEGKVTTAVAL